MQELSRAADRVCVHILTSDYPDIDIEIEIDNLRETCRELFPDRMALFDMIYISRFERLRQQFREPERVEGWGLGGIENREGED